MSSVIFEFLNILLFNPRIFVFTFQDFPKLDRMFLLFPEFSDSRPVTIGRLSGDRAIEPAASREKGAHLGTPIAFPPQKAPFLRRPFAWLEGLVRFPEVGQKAKEVGLFVPEAEPSYS